LWAQKFLDRVLFNPEDNYTYIKIP